MNGMVESVSLLAAVAEDFPVLHAGEGVLDVDASVFGVVLLLAARETRPPKKGKTAREPVGGEQQLLGRGTRHRGFGRGDDVLHAGSTP
ncbi:hypothetical protein I6J40_35440 (plasmid) [Streptomyces californicus]|nr:hypothetical protein I6J40_35440 [Streptomyces californicus]